MKSLLSIILVFGLQANVQVVNASESNSEQEILAKRGKGVVSQEKFDARVSRIPEQYKLTVLRDRNRFRDLLSSLLLNSQLANDAREANFHEDKLVVSRMKLAAETELAAAWMQHYIDSKPAADFDVLAHEYYRLHQDEFLSEEKIDVSHILVSSDERSQEEALSLANTIHGELTANPAAFDELVTKYSEDKSASYNMGKFKAVKRGDMVKSFEDKAFSQKPGDISSPVRTQYGYHIIRLDAYIPPEQLSFEQVKQQLVERESKAHEDRIRNDYIGRLTSLNVEMTQENMEEMVRRQFGEDYVDPETDKEKLE